MALKEPFMKNRGSQLCMLGSSCLTLQIFTWYFRCTLPSLKRSHVGIARLRHHLNLGLKAEEVSFVICIIAPKKEVHFLLIMFATNSSLLLSAEIYQKCNRDRTNILITYEQHRTQESTI